MRTFLSYKWDTEDANQWVERLARDLRSSGVDVSLDRWDVSYGQSFTEFMTSHISSADVMLFVITEAAVRAVESAGGSGAVKFEVQLATARRTAGDNFRFIGLLREGGRVPAHLRDYRYVDFRHEAAYEQSIAALVKDIFGISDRPPLGSGIRGLVGTRWEGVTGIHWMQLDFTATGKLEWLWHVDDPGGGDVFPSADLDNKWEQHGNLVRCVMNGQIYDGLLKEAVSTKNPLLSTGTTLSLKSVGGNWVSPFEVTLRYKGDLSDTNSN